MKKNTFYLTAPDNKEIFIREWLPETDAKAIIQIAHGMAEHSGRYEEFAEYLVSEGFGVYANDHRGHGQTEKDPEKLGYLADENGWQKVLDDLLMITENIRQDHPGIPVILLGHSFGSMLVRSYMIKYGDKTDGYIISGTNETKGLLLAAGKLISGLQGAIKGKKSPSKLMTTMSFGKFNSYFKPNKTEFDWLSRDEERNRNYVDDPFCGTVFSNGFFHDMLDMLDFLNKNYSKSVTDKPVLMFSGSKDPVGDFGKAVKSVYNKLKQAGVKDLTLKLYEDGRHEMLNETNRKEVYKDITDWITTHILNN